MKFTSPTNAILAASKFVGQVSKTKSTLTALSHTLLRIGDGAIQMSGCDLSVHLSARCACECDDPAEFGVPSALLSHFLSGLESDTVTGRIADSKLVLESGKSRAALGVLSASEFPAWPPMGQKTTICMPERELFSILRRVAPTIYRENDSRPQFAGACFRLGGGKLRAIVSNGRAISEVSVDFVGEGEWLIPTNIVDVVMHSLDSDSDGTCTMEFSENIAHFVCHSGEVSGALINDRFISDEVIDNQFPECKIRVDVPRSALLRAIKRLAPFHSYLFRSLIMEFGDGVLKISSIGGEHLGSDAIEIPPCEPFKFAINPDYIEPIASVISGDIISIGFCDDLRPILVEDGNFRSAILLMQIK